MGGPSRSQLSPRDKLRYLCGTKIQDVGNILRRVAAEKNGPVTKQDLSQALQACEITVPEDLLSKVWPKLEQNEDGQSEVWKALSGLAPPRVGIQIERLLGKIGRVQEAQERAITNKNYKQAAELNRTERRFCEELDDIPLDSDISSSAHKVQERELMKQVRNASTSSMRQNAEAALARFRELMKVGHTPRVTPRGGSFVVVDYERPRTSNINMIIDMLPPDNHQHWRGTLRKGQLGLWKDKHDRVTKNYEEIEAKYKYQRERAHALAFDKAPFPPQAVLERMKEDELTKTLAQSPERLSSPEYRPGTSDSVLSRPGTSASMMSRPMTSSGLTVVRPEMLKAVQILVERMHATGQSPAAGLGEMAGDTGVVTREQLVQAFKATEEAGGTEHVETICNALDRTRTGRVGVEELIGAIIAAVGMQEGQGKLWRHPQRGNVAVSERLWGLLHALQGAARKRWHRGAEDAFGMLERKAGEALEKRDVAAVLSYFALHASAADLRELWDFLQDGPGSGRAVSWAEFKAAFGIERTDEDSSAVQYATASPQGAARRLGQARRGRSRSVPPEAEATTEEEEIADIMSSTYNRFYAQGDDLDYFSAHGPLRHRGYHQRPSSRMRPLTSEPQGTPPPHGKSKRGVQWNVDGDPTPPRQAAGGTLKHTLRRSMPAPGNDEGASMAMVQPFTNFGSTLKMPWRRWAGGETIGPAKLPLQDPAAPGQTASLVPGTGEFRKSYEARVRAMKDLEASLAPAPPGTRGGEAVRELFPTGLASGKGSQPLRPPSRASTANTVPNSESGAAGGQGRAISNSQGILRKEMQDRGTAALIGEGTFWRDVGPPWEAVSSDIGSKATSPMPPLYENAMSKRSVLALKAEPRPQGPADS